MDSVSSQKSSRYGARTLGSGVTNIVLYVQAMGSLVRVSMPQNGIDAEGICALANAFRKNPNLEVGLIMKFDDGHDLIFSSALI